MHIDSVSKSDEKQDLWHRILEKNEIHNTLVFNLNTLTHNKIHFYGICAI